ncbi:MauE/DoxX family redox-associated membrane protein [Streptomyces albipurpureus]|uniref:Methylamine utilization protein MauE n=1 Tax=Streptomyces albipurpureus TaxID=2897419 RepID=A0ABT0UQE5_9ACTN|nr:MauE/DoxX family redox-associated membrane protein [Streptomyces sp. CWNU-1]MCM2390807.1 methylamine utilization protein MauE [Streptomyces sp. CWNU-1]
MYIALSCRILLFGVFLTALAGKVHRKAAFDEFTTSIRDMRLFSPKVAGIVAVAVAVGELAALVLLALPATASIGLALAALLLLGFTAGMGAALRRGRRTPCRCFGASVTPLGPVHLVRNLVLAAVGATGAAAVAIGGGAGWPPHPGGAAIAATAALVAVILVVRLDDLVALFSLAPAPATRATPLSQARSVPPASAKGQSRTRR